VTVPHQLGKSKFQPRLKVARALSDMTVQRRAAYAQDACDVVWPLATSRGMRG
jgi:hypothetical protein